MTSIKKAVDELHKAFNYLNRDFFAGSLPQVALTIQSKGKHLANGWFTPAKVWRDADQEIQLHEINISAEYLNREYVEVVRTLLHEMVHLYCADKGIQDTSRNGTYHNKEFKKAAEAHGFHYTAEGDKRYGWTFAELKPETVEKIESYDLDRDAFRIARVGQTNSRSKGKGGDSESGEGTEGGNGEKKSNSFKWVCPDCDAKIRSTKRAVHPVCGDCSDFDAGNVVRFILDE